MKISEIFDEKATNKKLNNININTIIDRFEKDLTIKKIFKLYEDIKEACIDDRVKNIHNKSKEINLITKEQYLYFMNNIFVSNNTEINNYNNEYNEIFELIFKRFRNLKYELKNNKTVFFITNIKEENTIDWYKLCIALTVFIQAPFKDKFYLLCTLTDKDEDGFICLDEIIFMIKAINSIFSNDLSFNKSLILNNNLLQNKIEDIIRKLDQCKLEDTNESIIDYFKKESYINYDKLYNAIISIKNFQYYIIPINFGLKNCLMKNNIKEIKLEINKKYKKDFIGVASELLPLNYLDKSNTKKPITKCNSVENLGKIISFYPITQEEKNRKVEITKSTFYSNLDNSSNKKYKLLLDNLKCPRKRNFNKSKYSTESNLINILKQKSTINKPAFRTIKNLENYNKVCAKKISFRTLIRCSNILSEENDKEDENKPISKRNKKTNKHNLPLGGFRKQYTFEANPDKIKNIEIQPILLEFYDEFHKTNKQERSHKKDINNVNLYSKTKCEVERAIHKNNKLLVKNSSCPNILGFQRYKSASDILCEIKKDKNKYSYKNFNSINKESLEELKNINHKAKELKFRLNYKRSKLNINELNIYKYNHIIN